MQTQTEKELRKRFKADMLMGCYHPSTGLSCGFFDDIRGLETEHVFFNACKEKQIVIEYTGSQNLVEGKYYKFKWIIPDEQSPYDIQMQEEATLVTEKNVIDALFTARQVDGKLLEDTVDVQHMIQNEVTGGPETFIYELLQNANDYPYEDQDVSVEFTITEKYLYFRHTGAEFSLPNIVGICSVYRGDKADNIKTIGYKGIGFKTVFVNNDYVYLKSGNWTMRFDRVEAEAKMYGPCQWDIMPIYTPWSELDNEVESYLENSSDTNFRVQFALRHRENNALSNLAPMKKVFDDDQILVFIPHVTDTVVRYDGKVIYHVTKDRAKWEVRSFTLPVTKEMRDNVKKYQESGGKIPKKYLKIATIDVAFAVNKSDTEIIPIPTDKARIYNYLPTEQKWGFPFLLNADFIPNGSRSDLQPVEWNKIVMFEAGRKFVDWFTELLSNSYGFSMTSVFSLLPDFKNSRDYVQEFKRGFIDTIKDYACIPCEDGCLHKISDIVLDESGLTSGTEPLLSDKQFLQFSGNANKHLPHKEIRNDKNLLNLVKGYSEFSAQVFPESHIILLCSNESFLQWLKIKENNIRFILFALTKPIEIFEKLYQRDLFYSADGVLRSCSKLYLNVDSYIDDIRFLTSFVHHLDPEVRREVEQKDTTQKWGTYSMRYFKQFNAADFESHIYTVKDSVKPLFQQLENSISFLHFLATNNLNRNWQSWYPLLDEESVVIDHNNLYLDSPLGRDFCSRCWVDSSWVKFIHPSYFKKDREGVAVYLRNNFSVSELSSSLIFDRIISDKQRKDFIKRSISIKESNVDFFHYLCKNGVCSNNLPSDYPIFVGKGQNLHAVTLANTIFLESTETEELFKQSWLIPQNLLCVSNCYYEPLEKSGVSKSDFDTFLQTKCSVFPFTLTRFAQSSFLANSLEFLKAIDTKEKSRDFLDFLFLNKVALFGNTTSYLNFKDVLVWTNNDQQVKLSASAQRPIYIGGEVIDAISKEPWVPAASFYVLNSVYSDLLQGKERQDFFRPLGLTLFNQANFISQILNRGISSLRECIKVKSSNVAFHAFIDKIRTKLQVETFNKIKTLPLYVESSQNADGLITEESKGHYIPSKNLEDIMKADLVPAETFAAIHSSYFQAGISVEYFTSLGNNELSEELFANEILSNKEKVSAYLKDINRNIRFWRWLCDADIPQSLKQEFRTFQILCYEDQPVLARMFASASSLYLPDSYGSTQGGEQLIRKYIRGPLFVSPFYKEEGDTRNWKSLFTLMGVQTDQKTIIYNRVLPRLKDISNIDVVFDLAVYSDDLVTHLKQNTANVAYSLSQLRLKCKDDQFRTISSCCVTGDYTDMINEPLSAIILPYALSDEYLEEGNTDRNRRVKQLLSTLAKNANVLVRDSKELAKRKFGFFVQHQKSYFSKTEHLSVISQLASYCFECPQDFSEVLRTNNMVGLNLYDKKGNYQASALLYLGQQYNPKCEFESHGVNLSYVSDEYAENYPDVPFKAFFKRIMVKEDFSFSDIHTLENYAFAKYFWENYSLQNRKELESILTFNNLSQIKCIPTPSGMCKPGDVYDSSISDLIKIVRQLTKGQTHVPSVLLPSWLGSIGLRSNLYIDDCLEYLKIKTTDFRSKVLEWLINTPDNVLEKNKQQIKDFAETAPWQNGKKDWVSLKDLYVLEWSTSEGAGNKLLRDFFQYSPYVCSFTPSFAPESKQNYNKLWTILGKTPLTKNDFHPSKVQSSPIDNVAVNEFNIRLLLLSYYLSKESWHENYNEYISLLSSSEIVKCSEILYEYNDLLHTKIRSYAEESDKLWYVGDWNGAQFKTVMKWFKDRFKLDSLNNDVLEQFLLDPISEILNTYGSDYTREFIGMLPLEYAKSLRVDSGERPQEYSGISKQDVPYVAPATTVPAETPISASTPTPQPTPSATPPSVETPKTQSHLPAHPNPEPKEPVPGKNNMPDSSKSPASPSATSTRPVTPAVPHTPQEPKTNSPASITPPENGKTTLPETPKSLKDKLRNLWEKRRGADTPVPTPSGKTVYDPTPISGAAGNVPEERGNFLGKESDPKSPKRSADRSAKARNNINKKNTNALKGAQQAQENLDLYELLDSTPEYTYLWFEYLMQIMFTEQIQSNDAARPLHVEFGIIEKKNETVFSLRQPTSYLPKWLETPTSIRVSPKNSVGLSFEPDVLFVKDDELAIDVSVLSPEQISFFEKTSVAIVIADGKSANHVKSLFDRFLKLNLPENYNLKLNLPQNITYIYGPAGTGKTTEVAKQIIGKLNGDRLNILALAPTNKAADVIAERILSNCGSDDIKNSLYRFGTTESSILIDEGIATPTNSSFITYEQSHIVVTTTARFAYNYLQKGESMPVAICDFPWDYVFIDEASMIDIVTISYILFKLKPKGFIIAGDPMQIKPVVQNDIEPENIYDMAGIYSFADAKMRSNVLTLDVQHRSVDSLGRLVSGLAYDGLLKSERSNSDSKPLALDIPGMSHFNFLGFRTDPFDMIYALDEVNLSAYHLYSVIFAYRFADYISKQIQEKYPYAIFEKGMSGYRKDKERYSIGIVSPYGAQARSIQNMLENRPLDCPQCKVSCGTVHSFQGDECDIMLVVLNPPSPGLSGSISSESHVNNLNLVNVALSRARDYLFVITPQNEIKGYTMTADIAKHLDASDTKLMYCSDIEERIWGDKQFIANNTNVELHMPVNVFYEPVKLYEVRKDDTAVDIQINDLFDTTI